MTMTKNLSIEQQIFRYLIARAKGKKNGYQAGIKRGALLIYLMAKQEFRILLLDDAQGESEGPDRVMRRLIRKMQKQGYRIGSHSNYGYFVVKTLKDLELAIEQRYKQLLALGQSIKWEKRNFRSLNQRKLKLKGAAA
jgi:hypothetical protein